MKKNWIKSVMLFFGLFSFYYLGCQKTDHPFGIYAPNGLDIPTATFTPVTGAIVAGVIDNNLPKAGVTVTATDPIGNLMTTVTDGFGLAAFNPGVLNLGVWTIEVPTQGRYYQSDLPLTVTGSNSSVTFTAGGQTIGATPVTPQTYGSSNTSVSYNLIYNQPYNLKVPMVLSAGAGLPAPWTKTFQPVTIGNSVNSSNVTIGKTGCQILNYPFSFVANDLLGAQIDTKPVTISRGFLIPVSFNISGGATFVPGPSGSAHTDYTLNCNFSSSNDCNYSYPVSISGSHPGALLNDYGQSFSFIGGGTRMITFSSKGTVNNEVVSVIINSPLGQFSGSVTTNTTFTSTLINTSY